VTECKEDPKNRTKDLRIQWSV